MSLIGTQLQPFTAEAFEKFEFKTITDADLKGKWSVVFFYPADFTFVCPTELEDLQEKYQEFQALGCEIYAVSTDSHFVHKAWKDASERIKKLQYPMLADPTHALCIDFDVLIEKDGQAERGTFIINPEGKIAAYEISAGNVGRNAEELLRKVAALSEKYQAPVFTHNSETRREVEECIARHGKTPTAYLDSLGLFQYGGGGYHCIHMTDEDIRIFRDRGLTAVTNPGSNTKLSSGIARISDMLDAGVRIAIGTDGPASNNCLDMFREMFLVTGLAKLRENNAAAVPAQEVLKMAVSGGTHGMGLTDCGCLAEGKLADLIVIDLNQPNMQPVNNIVKNLVYSGSKANVKLTMVNGRVLYEDGKFSVGTKPEEIYERANRIIRRMTE